MSHTAVSHYLFNLSFLTCLWMKSVTTVIISILSKPMLKGFSCRLLKRKVYSFIFLLDKSLRCTHSKGSKTDFCTIWGWLPIPFTWRTAERVWCCCVDFAQFTNWMLCATIYCLCYKIVGVVDWSDTENMVLENILFIICTNKVTRSRDHYSVLTKSSQNELHT